MLTGRKAAFIKKENYKDVTGFSNPKESEYDLFALGHTSTSVSLACGLAKARDLKHDSENVIAVIGDASLDGGEAFEALNCAAEINSNLIVVDVYKRQVWRNLSWLLAIKLKKYILLNALKIIF